jgi:hypothetical protein
MEGENKFPNIPESGISGAEKDRLRREKFASSGEDRGEGTELDVSALKFAAVDRLRQSGGISGADKDRMRAVRADLFMEGTPESTESSAALQGESGRKEKNVFEAKKDAGPKKKPGLFGFLGNIFR